jgi:hypothetical protein
LAGGFFVSAKRQRHRAANGGKNDQPHHSRALGRSGRNAGRKGHAPAGRIGGGRPIDVREARHHRQRHGAGQEHLLQAAPDRITIFNAETRVNYDRIMLSPALSGEKEFEEIAFRPMARIDFKEAAE